MPQQNFKNHRRSDHAFGMLQLLNLTLLVLACVALYRHHNPVHWMLAGLALSAVSLGIVTRRYAIRNQDRLIRLEENVRLHWMGIDPSGLTMRQMIALRFAGDAEVAALVARAKGENLSPKQIKEAVAVWRADHDRV